MVNKDNPKKGKKAELMIKNSLPNQQQIINVLKKKLKIKGELEGISRPADYHDKVDVTIFFDSGRQIDANIKSTSQLSFNGHLHRTSIAKFCKHFHLSENYVSDLERIILEKAKDSEKELFAEKDWKRWGAFFEKNAKELLKLAFSENPSREILVLVYIKKTSLVKIYAMKDVLRELSKQLSKQKIKRTKGGCDLGKNVSFQRKGGDGNVKTYPKTDIRHPSNEIQFKLKIGKDKDFLNNIELAKYNIQ